MKPFTYKLEGKGVISNRLYIKLRILRNTRIVIYFTNQALDRIGHRSVVDHCIKAGYQ